MKNTLKILRIFLVNIALIFLSMQSFAQPRGMTMNQVNQQTGRWVANQQMQFMQQLQMRSANWIQYAGKGAKYQVRFKDSSVKVVISYMYIDTVSHKSFLVFVDKKIPKSDTLHRNQKIYTDQTLYISTIADDESNTYAYGVPNDSCWMFKVINGHISVYAKSLDYLALADNLNENEFNISEIVGIQLNDGPIVKLTDDNLKQMVGEDANALESLEKRRYYKAVKKYNRHAGKHTKKQVPVSGE